MNRSIAGKVVFLPDYRSDNPYQSLMADALGREGVFVEFRDMPKGFFALNRLPKSVLANKVFHLHWLNDLLGHVVWPQTFAGRLLKLICLGLDILILRMRGKMVVWTVHNLVSHESPNVAAELAARRVVALTSSRLIFHSRSAVEIVEGAFGTKLGRKVTVIPHGNYDGCYVGDAELLLTLRNRLGVFADSVNLLFFGSIRQYKGVGQLIEAFTSTNNRRLRLVIAGNVLDPGLRSAILAASKTDSRIVPVLEFIPNDAVASFFSLADVVVLPYERTLTSGATVLAMTMGKATLLPQAARVFDLVDDQSSIFFDSVADLQEILQTLDKQDLARRGIHARRLADALNWSAIAKSVKRVYQ